MKCVKCDPAPRLDVQREGGPGAVKAGRFHLDRIPDALGEFDRVACPDKESE